MMNKYDQGTGKRERKRKFSSLSSEVPVKPLSVNKSYSGRKRRSPWLKAYTVKVLNELPDGDIPRNTNLQLSITYGVSNRSSDVDNLIKPFIDCLQEKYDFNDNQIYSLIVMKKIVKKGEEYIKWVMKVFHGDVDERKSFSRISENTKVE